MEVLSDIRCSGLDAAYASKQLVLRTSDDMEKIPGKAARQEGNEVVWAVANRDGEERRLPVYHRFASALVLDFGGTKADACAVLWLQDIVDNEEQEVELEIMEGKDLQQLAQCYISEHTKKQYVVA